MDPIQIFVFYAHTDTQGKQNGKQCHVEFICIYISDIFLYTSFFPFTIMFWDIFMLVFIDLFQSF